ncbi:MAG: tyrosine-type recombinase/integrase, partial [Proteobacteria bacterium]|nr:tyrosine-type recombinase/integrase [Pseudomonadota bacterium]
MMLTNTACQSAKPKKRPYKLSDSGGLYLLVNSNSNKLWRLKYRYLGIEKMLSFGLYPIISLAEAREKRDAAKKLLSQGIDPSTAKKAEKQQAIRNASNTFKAIALEWHANQIGKWSPNHALTVMRRFDVDIFPHIGSRPIADIDAPELLELLRIIEKRGALDVAMRVKQICGQVFRYGIATGMCKRDHAADLKGALRTGKVQHFAALDIKEMPAFLQALERNDVRLFSQTRRAIRLLMLLFTRTIELIHAKWAEFDLENAQWEIPAERMKMGKAHIVPLSKQAVDLLKAQQEETRHLKTDFVFPSQIRPKDPMSNNTILFAIGRLGYKYRMTGHGFRALARTAIREKLGYDGDVIERQLAHAVANKVVRAYDRTQFLPERKKMMQQWSDYLDAIA